MVSYLVCSMVLGLGNLVVNAVLLALLIPTIIISIPFRDKKVKKAIKKKNVVEMSTLRRVKRAFSIAKKLVKTYTLALTIYGIFIAITVASPIAIISMICSIVAWVLSLIAEIGSMVLDAFKNSWEKDKEELVSRFSEGKDYAVEKFAQGKEYAIGKCAEGKEYAQEKYAEGKEFVIGKYAEGKEYVQEKYEQGKEYAQGVVEQGKVKLDESKTAFSDFFKRNKKAE